MEIFKQWKHRHLSRGVVLGSGASRHLTSYSRSWNQSSNSSAKEPLFRANNRKGQKTRHSCPDYCWYFLLKFKRQRNSVTKDVVWAVLYFDWLGHIIVFFVHVLSLNASDFNCMYGQYAYDDKHMLFPGHSLEDTVCLILYASKTSSA